MAARPKERRVKAALGRRAKAIGVTPLAYVEHWLRQGGRFTDLARSLALELNESVSRQLASGAAHHLADDAAVRIVLAHRVGRTAARDGARRAGITVDRAHRSIGASLILDIAAVFAA